MPSGTASVTGNAAGLALAIRRDSAAKTEGVIRAAVNTASLGLFAAAFASYVTDWNGPAAGVTVGWSRPRWVSPSPGIWVLRLDAGAGLSRGGCELAPEREVAEPASRIASLARLAAARPLSTLTLPQRLPRVWTRHPAAVRPDRQLTVGCLLSPPGTAKVLRPKSLPGLQVRARKVRSLTCRALLMTQRERLGRGATGSGEAFLALTDDDPARSRRHG